MKQQRRGKAIAMTDDERDAFLASERTCRVATVGRDGAPHVTPLWFVWDGTLVADVDRAEPAVRRCPARPKDQRGRRCRHGLHGASRRRDSRRRPRRRGGPRAGDPEPELDTPERLYADKYAGGHVLHDGRHAWLRIDPEKVTSWDFRKINTQR